ncbi:MAG: HDIG domain-containing protein [Ardenticatenaceae bacterium]|nr:HDIG domain-containing protein [Ardenticatenaceae bacterium]
MENQSRWRQTVQDSVLWIFTAVLTLGLTLIFSFTLLRPTEARIIEGIPAPEDIFAPRAIIYESAVALRQAQEQARASVPEQYKRIEGDVGRFQLNRVVQTFAFIDIVRADTQASTEAKLTYLEAVTDLNIEEQVALDLLNMNDADYARVKSEVQRIVGDLMRREIRDTQLRELQQQAQRDASLDLTPTQERVVKFLAPRFIVPTMEPDPVETERKREEAAAAVPPFPITVAKDELVVRAGDIVTERHIEKMTQLGLLQRQTDWRFVVAIAILSLLSSVLIALYWRQFYHGRRVGNGRYLTALAGLILVFALAARFMLTSPGLIVYLFPMAAFSLLLSVLFDVRLSIVITMILAGLIGFNAANSLEIAIYTAAGGLLAVLTLHDAQRINSFFRAGLAAATGYAVVVVAFQFDQTTTDPVSMVEILGYTLGNGLLSAALTLVGFFIMGSIFGVTTTLQLQELSRLDHPLLQELLRRAPGTYHHSIMVANLAEQAAEQIKANSTLIRVGAFYHDIGKMNRPAFFTENQEGVNPHDALDPYTSARIILSHVTDGLELAQQYKLPDRIRDFIAEHHGQRLVKGFYHKAVDMAGANGEVDREKFRYPGPRPRSRESGIVMLADAVESTSRALQPHTEKEIEKLVNTLIDEDLTEGQLDDSGLTLGDIHTIRASFIKTLKGRFHVRTRYPGNEAMQIPETRPLPSPPEQPSPAPARTTQAANGAETAVAAKPQAEVIVDQTG